MTTTAATAAAAPPRTPLWEDFLDIYYAPREVFARRSEACWGVVLLMLTAAMALLFYASQGPLSPALEADFGRAMQGSPGLSAEQMEQARRMAGIFGTLTFVVGFPVGVLLTGLALWTVARLFGSATVAGALLIATYAHFPRLLQQLAALLQGLMLDADGLRSLYAVTLSPARFLDPDATSQTLLALASRLDLFVLWSTVLLAIGLQVVGRLPRAQALLAAAAVWLLGALPMVVGALFGG